MFGIHTVRNLINPEPPTPPRVLYTAPSGAVYWADMIEFAPDADWNWVLLVVYYDYDEAKRTWKSMTQWTIIEATRPENKAA